jgi:hypothetical protein
MTSYLGPPNFHILSSWDTGESHHAWPGDYFELKFKKIKKFRRTLMVSQGYVQARSPRQNMD